MTSVLLAKLGYAVLFKAALGLGFFMLLALVPAGLVLVAREWREFNRRNTPVEPESHLNAHRTWAPKFSRS